MNVLKDDVILGETDLIRCELVLTKKGQLFMQPIEGCDGIFLNRESMSTLIKSGDKEKFQLSDKDLIALGNYNHRSNERSSAIPPKYRIQLKVEIKEINEDGESINGSSMYDSESDDGSSEELSQLTITSEDSSGIGGDNDLQPWNSVFKNKNILSRIFSYLPFSTLKTVRQVSHLWKNESRQYFLPLVTISLQPNATTKDWERGLHHYSENVSAYGHQNFKVCYSGHPSDGFVEEDVIAFIKRHGRQFKTLEMVILPGRNDFAFLRDILSDPSLINLGEVSITLIFNESDYTSRYWKGDGGILLPSVKSLSLNFGFDGEPSRELVEFVPTFVHSFPHIEKFEITTDDSMECILEQPVLEELVNFGNLTEIRLQWATPQVVDILIDFPRCLKVIDVHVDRHEVDTGRIQNLLDRHCLGLVELSLAIHCESGVDLPVGEPGVEMPSFPRIRKLSYTFYMMEDTSARLELGDVDLLGFRGVIAGGNDSFKKQFPLLTSFQYILPSRDYEEEFFHQLFPAKDSQGDALQIPQIIQFRTGFSCFLSQGPGAYKERIQGIFTGIGKGMKY